MSAEVATPRMLYRRLREAARGKNFVHSVLVAALSGSLSACLFVADRRTPFIRQWVPDGVVFNVFVTFASLVAAFRTSNALGRYTDAAMYLHKLSAAWFDTTSTLIAFCRVATAPPREVEQFKQVLVRLMSLMNALCLEYLESGGRSGLEGRSGGYRFSLLGSEDLGPEMCSQLLSSEHKVEYIFQLLQQLIVDAQASGVLSIAPPILTRSHQEMGAGIMVYHEAKKIACVPLPTAYVLITVAILIIEAVYMPFMMAIFVQGAFSAFLYTFGGTFLLWFVNSVADTLDNPFRAEAQTLDASSVQRELNEQLMQLVLQSQAGFPRIIDELVLESWSEPCLTKKFSTRNSLSSWSRNFASTMTLNASEKSSPRKAPAQEARPCSTAFALPPRAEVVEDNVAFDAGDSGGAAVEAAPELAPGRRGAGRPSGPGAPLPRGGRADDARATTDVGGPPLQRSSSGTSASRASGLTHADPADSEPGGRGDADRLSWGQSCMMYV